MGSKRQKIGIVAVDYRSYEDTVQLVRCVSDLRWSHAIRLVVVNNSTDGVSRGLLDALAEEYGDRVEMIVCHSPRNLGYFGGLNYGLPFASAVDPEWIVCCNADIIFAESTFVKQLLELKVDESVLALAPAIITRKGRNQNPFLLRRPSRARWLIYDVYFSCYAMFGLISLANGIRHLVRGGRGRKPSQLPNVPTEIYAPHGACFILNRQYFEKYSRLDDTLVLYGEEIVLAETVRDAGGRILYVPTLKVVHNESGSIGNYLGRSSYRAFQMGRKVHRYLTQRYFLRQGTYGDNAKARYMG